MWVELLIGWSKFLSRHDQSEALPRSRKWHVISMDSEFLQSLLRRYFAGKPVVARFVKLSGVIEFVPFQRLWINVACTQLVRLQYSTKLYGQCTLWNKIPSQIFSWFCMYSASFDNCIELLITLYSYFQNEVNLTYPKSIKKVWFFLKYLQVPRFWVALEQIFRIPYLPPSLVCLLKMKISCKKKRRKVSI